MKTLNASDAKHEFGEVLINAQHGPVGIKRNGKPVAVVISAAEYAQLEALKETHLKQAIEEGIADLQARLSSVGYGEARPAYRNDTEEGRRLNCRVEFKVLSRQRSLCSL